MNKKKWLECTDPEKMLNFLKSKRSDRKLRLLSCACCRQVWEMLDERSRQPLEVAEKYADGLAMIAELEIAYIDACNAWSSCNTFPPSAQSAAAAVHNTCCPQIADTVNRSLFCLVNAAVEAKPSTSNFPNWEKVVQKSEQRKQLKLLRCIFGNPFRPVTINPSWLTWTDDTVRRIAQAIYDEKAFDKMPILADALEDAGCDNEDILNHCRSGETHVRGCWVVDLLLGKK